MQSGSTGLPLWQHSPVMLSVRYAVHDCCHFESMDEKTSRLNFDELVI